MNNFDLKAYMDVTPEIEEAVRTGKPVVALESTILSHGMPYPENLSFAREVEKIIREQGAIPATMAIIDGRLKCGLTEAELVRMCEAKGVLKVSRRDLPIVVAQKLTGATTVATTMILANMAGIHIFATGGIGGVHRHGASYKRSRYPAYPTGSAPERPRCASSSCSAAFPRAPYETVQTAESGCCRC